MILSSIKSGFNQTWQNKRIALIYYLANLFFGVILMLPFRSILSKFIRISLMGEKLAGRLDLDFLFEFIPVHCLLVTFSFVIWRRFFCFQQP